MIVVAALHSSSQFPLPPYLQAVFRFLLLLLLVIAFPTFGQSVDGVTIREVFIPMPDGIRLAVDLYVPENSKPEERLPVLLEYLPYRKDEGRRNRFGLFHYFVKRGYVVARVDIRGTGRSEGKLVEYEYSEQEQKDGEVVIDWLSKQSFSNGSVGMFGISWGGFNAIHLAMRRPPALKAIITLMSTDDIYQDDVHFIDGMMHVDAYEIGQDLGNILPGAPDFVLDEVYFKNRFETTPWLLQYKMQQRDGPFWDRASLNADYTKINIPVFAIGGWYDGYRDAVFRMFEHLSSPVKAMIGPWNHTFPNWADPPPAIEWREEAVQWFDRWLKGIENGILDKPRFSAFIRDGHSPGSNLKAIDGKWYHSKEWPVDGSGKQKFALGTDRNLLAEPVDQESVLKLTYRPDAGYEAGGSVLWWGDWSPDQRTGDSLSLVFETASLAEDVTILGFPTAHIVVGADAKRANWFVRLSDRAPDGSVTLVTGAGANGTHRKSAENPEDIQPGEEFPFDIEMHATSWTFRRGHRIRISISNALWPMIWTSPTLFTSTLRVGGRGSWLELPILHGSGLQRAAYPEPTESPEWPGYSSLASGTNSGFAEVKGITHDEKTGTSTLRMTNEDGVQYPWGKTFGTEEIVHRVNTVDPAKTLVESRYTTRIELKNRTLLFAGNLVFGSDRDYFYYTYTRSVTENGKLLRTKTWKERIRRDFH